MLIGGEVIPKFAKGFGEIVPAFTLGGCLAVILFQYLRDLLHLVAPGFFDEVIHGQFQHGFGVHFHLKRIGEAQFIGEGHDHALGETVDGGD